MTKFKKFTVACLATLTCASTVLAEGHETTSAEDVFLPENAILDTSILFAIGAREAQQELRGSYGWDTFQEGLVEGVYFRFDPDGYARFSPNARLDSDLFEVLCRPRTLNCVARKGSFSVTINAQGMLQLSIEGVAAGDQFFISDLVNEIELPDRILQPLDATFENVLAVGGDLIVRRGQNETQRVSLIGFSAVVSYLRWILAEQDYLALPRNWPVPNGTTAETTTLTAPDAWRNVAVGASTAQVQASDAALIEASSPASEEIASLRALVEQMSNAQNLSTSTQSETATPMDMGRETPPAIEYELSKAIARIDALERELARFDATMSMQSTMNRSPANPDSQSVDDLGMAPDEMKQPHLIQLASQIQQLTEEFGIDPSVAALLLRHKNRAEGNHGDWSTESINLLLSAADTEGLEQAVQLVESEQPVEGSESGIKQQGTPSNEFMLLTDYFRSVTN